MISILARAEGLDLQGRLARVLGGGGTDTILLVLGIGALALFIGMQVRRSSIIIAYIVCLMFSGHQIALLDTSSTLLRWLLIGCLVLSVEKGASATGPICTMLGVHWAYSIFSVLWSPTPEFGIQLSVLSFLLTVPAAMSISNEVKLTGDLGKLPRVLNACALIYIVNAIVGFSGFSGARYSGGTTSAPLFVITGGLLLPSLLWGYLTTTKLPIRRRNAVSFALIFTLCFLSGQRTGLFAGMLGCLPLLLAQRGKKSNLVIVAVILAVGITYGAMVAFPEQTDFLHRRYATTSVTGREHAWRWGFNLISQNPILGYGAGSHTIRWFGFHNAFLQEWHNAGLSGLFLYAGALLLALTKTFRISLDSKRSLADQELARLLLGWTIALVSGAFFESKLASPSNILAFITVNVGILVYHLELAGRKRPLGTRKPRAKQVPMNAS